MHLTEQGVTEELEKFFTHPGNHVVIRRDRNYMQNRLIALEIISPLPGITQMLREHFARFTNVRVAQAQEAPVA